MSEWDEFRHCTPGAKAGVLYIRELANDVLLTVARDVKRATPEFQAVYAAVEALGDGGRPTNTNWVSGRVLDEAYARQILGEWEFDQLWDASA